MASASMPGPFNVTFHDFWHNRIILIYPQVRKLVFCFLTLSAESCRRQNWMNLEGEELWALQETPSCRTSSWPPKQHGPPHKWWDSLPSHTGPGCLFCAVGSQKPLSLLGVALCSPQFWIFRKNIGGWKEKGSAWQGGFWVKTLPQDRNLRLSISPTNLGAIQQHLEGLVFFWVFLSFSYTRISHFLVCTCVQVCTYLSTRMCGTQTSTFTCRSHLRKPHFSTIKTTTCGAGEMPQQLGAMTAPSEDLGSISSTSRRAWNHLTPELQKI